MRDINHLVAVAEYILSDDKECDDFHRQCEDNGVDPHDAFYSTEPGAHVYVRAMRGLGLEYTCGNSNCKQCAESD